MRARETSTMPAYVSWPCVHERGDCQSASLPYARRHRAMKARSVGVSLYCVVLSADMHRQRVLARLQLGTRCGATEIGTDRGRSTIVLCFGVSTRSRYTWCLFNNIHLRCTTIHLACPPSTSDSPTPPPSVRGTPGNDVCSAAGAAVGTGMYRALLGTV